MPSFSQMARDALWPERIPFSQDFQHDGDRDGQIESDSVPQGSARAVVSICLTFPLRMEYFCGANTKIPM